MTAITVPKITSTPTARRVFAANVRAEWTSCVRSAPPRGPCSRPLESPSASAPSSAFPR